MYVFTAFIKPLGFQGRGTDKKATNVQQVKQARQADCSSAFAIYGVQRDPPHTMSLLGLLRYVLQEG